MDLMKIGKFLSELRHENNLTQEELGTKLGVTNKTISRWENGNYLPSVEMLQLLSNEFAVSINELLCGERLNDSSYRQKADCIIIDVLKNSTFTLKEQYAFWKSKWLKEHRALIIIGVTLFITLCSFSIYLDKPLLLGLSFIIAFVLFLKSKNQMMAYIEGHVFDDSGL